MTSQTNTSQIKNLNTNSKKKPFTDNLIDICVNEFNKPNIKNKIKTNIVDPIVNDINERYYYQFLMVVGLLITIVFLLLMLLAKIKKIQYVYLKN